MQNVLILAKSVLKCLNIKFFYECLLIGYYLIIV